MMTEKEFNKGNEAVRLAHNLATQGMIARQAEHNEALRQAINREAVDIPKEEYVGQNLNIDSPTTNNYHMAPEAKKPKPMSGLLKSAIGAALLASGVGLGLPLLLDGGKEVITNTIEKQTTVEDVVTGFGKPD
jgi:hypothetical protein